MALLATQTSNSVEAALEWARSEFGFVESKAITNHPWAKTIRLDADGGAAYLKILPFDPARRVWLLSRLAECFPDHTPRLLAADEASGFLLYSDHEGASLDSNPDHDTRLQLLAIYAELQRGAAESPALLTALPVQNAGEQIDRLLAFLSGDGLPDGHVGAQAYLGAGSAARYLGVFSAVEDVFRAFLADADKLTPTVNHCDLRPANVARRPDGSLVIFDWDDAVSGPPGLSLHNFFRGCVRPWQVLTGEVNEQDETAKRDRELLEAYCQTLSQSEGWGYASLTKVLPSAICAGVIKFIVSFGEFPTESDRLRKTIGRNIRRRLSSLMDLSALLVHDKPKQKEALAQAFIGAGRKERAQALTGLGGPIKVKVRSGGVITSHDSGEFPAIAISSHEHKNGNLDRENHDKAVTLFDSHGALLIKDALPMAAVERCRDAFFERYDKYLSDVKHDDALRVGNKRFMITVELSPPFSDSEILTSPMFMPIVQEFLGEDLILGSLTCVASLPGSKTQSLHKDHKALFREKPELQLPSFAMSVVVPLIGLDAATGGTRVLRGSHRVSSDDAKSMPGQTADMPLGSCYLMDYRLSHHGLANRSDKVRPILCMIFHRPWFRDYINFGKQNPMVIPPGAKAGLSKEIKRMTAWASQE